MGANGKCFVKNCKNALRFKKKFGEKEEKKVTYHRFPKNKQRRQQWAKALQLEEEKVTDHHRVCSDHFFEKDFDHSLCRVRLRESAVPFVFHEILSESSVDANVIKSEAKSCSVEILNKYLEKFIPESNGSTSKRSPSPNFNESMQERLKTQENKELIGCDKGNECEAMEKMNDIYDLCVFKGCPNEDYDWGKRLFPFPQSTDPLFKIWLENCGNESILGRSDRWIKKFGLCSDHFTPDSFYDEDKKKLRQDAVPEPYSPTFKRPYTSIKTNARIYDHNYALVTNAVDQTFPDYNQPTRFPLRRYNAADYIPPSSSSDVANNNGGQKTGRKRGMPLCRIYARENVNGGKNDVQTTNASSSNESALNTNTAEPGTDSRLAVSSTSSNSGEGKSASSLAENISGNTRGKVIPNEGGNKLAKNNPQVGVSGLKNGEVGILQETNEELRTQNKLLRKLNGQLKLKLKRSDDRNKMLKVMLERVSSIDGFLDLHRCMNLDVRNLIKEEIHKCKTPPKSE